MTRLRRFSRPSSALIETEEVPPQDVVVLSSHNREKSAVGQAGLPGEYFYVDKPEPVGPYVRFSSIRGFKGLESPVVVLCELEDLDERRGISSSMSGCPGRRTTASW